MFKLGFRESCRLSFKNRKILTVYGIYLYKLLIFIKTNVKKYEIRSQKHQHYTRQSNMLCKQFVFKNFYSKSPSIAGIDIYNTLPDRLKNIKDIKHFKFEIKKMLLEKPVYDLKEYDFKDF